MNAPEVPLPRRPRLDDVLVRGRQIVEQTEAFAESESFRYFTDRTGFTRPTISVDDLHAVAGPIRSILDAGCGTGVNLAHLVDVTGASRGTGIEPNADTVAQLRRNHEVDPRLEFHEASVHRLPFPSDSFDLVVCWSVLHWVGREEYLQALGELIRVTAKYLIVMDFVGSQDYRVPYHHRPGLFTYKMDFEPPLMASGILDCIDVVRWWEPEAAGPRIPVAEGDLTPFVDRELNYHARKVGTFHKNLERLPTYVIEDFASTH